MQDESAYPVLYNHDDLYDSHIYMQATGFMSKKIVEALYRYVYCFPYLAL